MSDNLRRYRAIHEALTQCYSEPVSGRMAQHLTTLAAFIVRDHRGSRWVCVVFQ
jgi:hypothetical protein